MPSVREHRPDLDYPESQEHADEAASAPGKRTLVEAVIMRRAEDGAQRGDARGALDKAAGSHGTAPETGVVQKVERSTGADLSSVRVHTDDAAHAAAKSVSARAFTAG